MKKYGVCANYCKIRKKSYKCSPSLPKRNCLSKKCYFRPKYDPTNIITISVFFNIYMKISSYNMYHIFTNIFKINIKLA